MSDLAAQFEGVRESLNAYVDVLRRADVKPVALFLHRSEFWDKKRLFNSSRPRHFSRHDYSTIGLGWPVGDAPELAQRLFYVVDVGVYAATLRTCPTFGSVRERDGTNTTTSGPAEMSAQGNSDGHVWIVGQYEYDGVHRGASATTGIAGLSHVSAITTQQGSLDDHLASLAREFLPGDS
ncbi:hypothetical protein BH09ACT8_BH09ACT8_12100 [soil metagenome]